MRKYRFVSPSIQRNYNFKLKQKYETEKKSAQMQYFDLNEARKKHQIQKPKEMRRPKHMTTTNLTMQKFSDCSNLFIDSPFIKPEK
jgi:hypothetical protein